MSLILYVVISKKDPVQHFKDAKWRWREMPRKPSERIAAAEKLKAMARQVRLELDDPTQSALVWSADTNS